MGFFPFVSSLTFMRCPFCKTPNYAVEYRGVKSKEEKGIEQVVSLKISTQHNFFLDKL